MQSQLTTTTPASTEPGPTRVLLIDDDERVRAAFGRQLTRAGFVVETTGSAEEAWGRVAGAHFDVVITDIQMPGMTGVELLSRLHQLDPDLPVILMTGQASLQSAITAVQESAFSYLTKPLDPHELVEQTLRAASHGATASRRTYAVHQFTQARIAENERRVQLESDFEAALAGLALAFQPIIDGEGAVRGYEALLRTSSQRFRSPPEVLEAAGELGALDRVGRAVRAQAAEIMLAHENPALLFVNLHVTDLLDDDLYDPAAPLTRMAGRVVLEITERASIDTVSELGERIATLRRLDFRIAVDDLGAGYAGLASIAQLEPEVIKLDMSLVRGIDQSPTKQRLVGSLVPIAGHLGAIVVAEGVETLAERDTLLATGCQLLQGYLFARPGPPFPSVRNAC